jgi:predicted phosphodiesterase
MRLRKKLRMNDDWKTLVPFGDLHMGYATANLDKMQKVVDYIKAKDCKWIGMGDFIDNTPPSHRFYRQETSLTTPQQQVFDFVELVRPIKDTCIGLIYGNHEIRSLDYKTGYDPIKQMEELLGLSKNYRGLGTQHYFHEAPFDIFATHGKARGFFFSTRTATKINQLLKLHELAEADLYLMGHVHDILHFPINYVSGVDSIVTKYFVLTGGFVEYFGSYGEAMNYTPVETGCNAVHLNIYKKEVKVERIC